MHRGPHAIISFHDNLHATIIPKILANQYLAGQFKMDSKLYGIKEPK